MKTISIPFQLEKSFFVERPNRFLIRCELEKSPGTLVDVHLADSGRLGELLVPGRSIFLSPVENETRKTRWTAVLCESPEGHGLVSINSTLPNRLIGKALAEQAIEELADWTLIRGEFALGNQGGFFCWPMGLKRFA